MSVGKQFLSQIVHTDSEALELLNEALRTICVQKLRFFVQKGAKERRLLNLDTCLRGLLYRLETVTACLSRTGMGRKKTFSQNVRSPKPDMEQLL
jgi:hypothetical protein